MTRSLLLLLACAAFTFAASCTSPDGRAGVCQSNTSPCAGAFFSGVCAGPADVLCCVPGASQAFSLSVSQSALTYFKDLAIPLVLPKLQNMALPDFSGNVSVPVVGTVSYALSNMVINTISLGTTSVQLVPPTAVAASASNVTLSLTANFKWAQAGFPFASGSGTATIVATNANANLQLSSALASGGKIHLHADSVAITMQQLDVKISGSVLDSILNYLVNAFKDRVKSAVSNAVPAVVGAVIDNVVNPLLDSLKTTFVLEPQLALNYAWTAAPSVTSSFVRVAAAVEAVYAPSPAQHCPSPHHLLPAQASSRMARIVLDEYALNSMAWAARQAGLLSIVITNQMLGPDAKFHLNTVDLLPVMPSFFLKYPNKEMQIGIGDAQVVATVTATGIAFAATAVSDVFVIMNATAPGRFRAFSVYVHASGALTPSLERTTLHVALTSLSCSITLKDSQIGSISVSFFSTVMGWLCPGVILKQANAFLSKGFPIPALDGMSLVKPALSLGPGYLVFDTDLFYSPGADADQLDEIAVVLV